MLGSPFGVILDGPASVKEQVESTSVEKMDDDSFRQFINSGFNDSTLLGRIVQGMNLTLKKFVGKR